MSRLRQRCTIRRGREVAHNIAGGCRIANNGIHIVKYLIPGGQSTLLVQIYDSTVLPTQRSSIYDPIYKNATRKHVFHLRHPACLLNSYIAYGCVHLFRNRWHNQPPVHFLLAETHCRPLLRTAAKFDGLDAFLPLSKRRQRRRNDVGQQPPPPPTSLAAAAACTEGMPRTESQQHHQKAAREGGGEVQPAPARDPHCRRHPHGCGGGDAPYRVTRVSRDSVLDHVVHDETRSEESHPGWYGRGYPRLFIFCFATHRFE